eukprot:2482748-Rhodomonas_salina.4
MSFRSVPSPLHGTSHNTLSYGPPPSPLSLPSCPRHACVGFHRSRRARGERRREGGRKGGKDGGREKERERGQREDAKEAQRGEREREQETY